MDEQNIHRVDNRPASIYSVVIFILVFTVIYMFYPQLSMFVPFLGEKTVLPTKCVQTGINGMVYAQNIVIVEVYEKEKAQVGGFGSDTEVFRRVNVHTKEILKGSAEEEFFIKERGGTVLLKNGASKKKYIVSYENSPEFTVGKSYILFLDGSGEILNEKYGAVQMNDNGSFTDTFGNSYTKEEILLLTAEAGK